MSMSLQRYVSQEKPSMQGSHDRIMLSVIIFCVLLAQVLLYPGIDILVRSLGGGPEIGASMWFLAIEFAAFILFAGVWGAASDRAGKRIPFIMASGLAGAGGYAALASLLSVGGVPFSLVLLLRMAQGAATIGAFSLAMTMLMDLEGGHGLNMGAAGIAIGFGTALGAPLGGFLYERSPGTVLLTACGLLIVVAGLSLIPDDQVPDPNRQSLFRILVSVRSTPELSLPYAFGFLDRLTAGLFALVGTLYFRTVFELGPGATGLMLALFFAPFALLQYPMGILSDRVGRTLPVIVGSVCYGIGVVAVGHASRIEYVGALMVGVGVLGALMAPATMALVTDISPQRQRGISMAGFNVFGSFGFLVGILVGGAVADRYGFTMAFTVAGGLEILLAIIAVPAFLRWEFDRTIFFSRSQ